MLKLTPNRLRTTDYVRLSQLPATEAHSLRSWLPESCLTKLETEDALLNDCIAYEDYEFWYEYSRKDDESTLDEQL